MASDVGVASGMGMGMVVVVKGAIPINSQIKIASPQLIRWHLSGVKQTSVMVPECPTNTYMCVM